MAKVKSSRTALTAGVLAATLTPMQTDGSPDVQLMAEHCKQLRAEGCSGIVVLGTTGEANSFSVAERRSILESLLTAGLPPDECIVGTGCCARYDTVELTRHALGCGVTRALMLPPFYYKNVSDDGIFESFARAIDEVGDGRLRVYLYLIPQMSGVNIGLELIERLLRAYPEAIAGLKDSSGDWSATEILCRRLGERMDVLVGTEVLLVRAVNSGASGCVSATANVNAAAIHQLFADRRNARAKDLETRVIAKRVAFEKFPMIPALKCYLAATSGKATWRNVRAPLRQLETDHVERLLADVARSEAW